MRALYERFRVRIAIGWRRFFDRGAPKKPRFLTIEPTNRCNLNCPFCLVGQQNELASTDHDELPRDWGSMDLPLVEKITREAKAFGIDKIQLFFQGEPFMHKQFVEFIRISKRNGLYTQVFTNGLLLTPELSRQVVRAGLDVLRFSVDGTTQDVYEKNRVGGRFDLVYKNMADIVRIAKEEKSPIRLRWQFIAMRNNEHQIEEAAGKAKEIGIPFLVKTYAESVPGMAPQNPKYRRKILPKPCTDIYENFMVYWNGDVVPCCYDLAGKEIMGNLRTQTLDQVWNSERYRNFRSRVDQAAEFPDQEPEICKSCLKWGHCGPANAPLSHQLEVGSEV